MPSSHFSVERQSDLSVVPAGGNIHIIGVCGVAMAQLAIALSKQGFHVSGSDTQFYEPMGSVLRNSEVEILEGFDAAHLSNDCHLAVIANAPYYENPEVLEVESRGLPYSSFPQILSDVLIASRHSIVVAGTHGKSTTTAMLASTLRKCELDPSFFIGGVVPDLDTSFHVGEGSYSVVEGDEYMSAFFARYAKFRFYKPQTFIIGAIEYDHADMYSDVEAVREEFRKGAALVPADGRIIACADFPEVRRLLSECSFEAPVITFGSDPDSNYQILDRRSTESGQSVSIRLPDSQSIELNIPLLAEYNARNATAAFAVASELKLDRSRFASKLATYQPVKRRQERRFESASCVFIEDFAHHPTSAEETIRGFKEVYPHHRLVAVFEPRSNTSRRKVFQEHYLRVFEPAQRAIICEPTGNRATASSELLNVESLVKDLQAKGITASALEDADAILPELIQEAKDATPEKPVLITVMSNGGFGGLPGKLAKALAALPS